MRWRTLVPKGRCSHYSWSQRISHREVSGKNAFTRRSYIHNACFRPSQSSSSVHLNSFERKMAWMPLCPRTYSSEVSPPPNSRQTQAKMGSLEDQANITTITMDNMWEQPTTDFLDTKSHTVGSLDSLQWQQMETMILYWTGDRRQGPSTKGIRTAFGLLDRLVDEMEMHHHNSIDKDNAYDDATSGTNQHHSRRDKVVHIYIVHAILKAWKKHTAQVFSDRGSISGGEWLRPSEVLTKLDNYLSRCPTCFQPNVATYTIILDCASHCPDPRERLQFTKDLLDRLLSGSEKDGNPELLPTEVTFGTVLAAWARTSSVEAATKAEQLLRDLQDGKWASVAVTPNAHMYSSVIHAWARAGNIPRAEEWLQDMYKAYLNDHEEQQSRDQRLRPNVYAFNSLLSAWSKSNSKGAVEASRRLIDQMKDLHDSGVLEHGPNFVSYNCLLNTIVKHEADGLLQARGIVEEMMKRTNDRSSSSQPSEATFVALFRILARSKSSDRDEISQEWMELAKQCGVESRGRFFLPSS